MAVDMSLENLEACMYWGPWNSVRGESNCWTSELVREEREPGVRRTFLLGSRTVIGYGHGFVRVYSTYPDDTIRSSVTMTYAEAIQLDRNLRPITRSLGLPGINFQRRSRSWFLGNIT